MMSIIVPTFTHFNFFYNEINSKIKSQNITRKVQYFFVKKKKERRES